MTDLDKAVATQLANIEKRTGRTIAELTSIVQSSGLSKHGELVAMLKGSDFEVAPKKTYVSYRRKKQFCTVGPATGSRVDVGINMKGVSGTERLDVLPAGQMCQYKVRVTSVERVDAELVGWLRQAYDAAG